MDGEMHGSMGVPVKLPTSRLRDNVVGVRIKTYLPVGRQPEGMQQQGPFGLGTPKPIFQRRFSTV
jgi:hypothetical protein